MHVFQAVFEAAGATGVKSPSISTVSSKPSAALDNIKKVRIRMVKCYIKTQNVIKWHTIYLGEQVEYRIHIHVILNPLNYAYHNMSMLIIPWFFEIQVS